MHQVNELEILTVTGRKVLSKTIHESETQLDVSSLPPGIYLLKIRHETGAAGTHKLLIKR
jgi:hypothetical protein